MLRRFSAAVATSREDQRPPRAGGPRWNQECDIIERHCAGHPTSEKTLRNTGGTVSKILTASFRADGTSAYSLRAAYAMAVPGQRAAMDAPPGTRTVTEPNP